MLMHMIIATVVLSLTACSNVLPGALLLNQSPGGGPGGFLEPEPQVTFQPNEKPKHPASPVLVQSLLGDLKSANSYLPEDAAYFTSVIVGDTVREVYSGSYDQLRALKKLAPEGRAFVKSLLSYCQLTPAKKTESGKNQPGNRVHTSLLLSAQGPSCGYVLKKSLQRTKAISTVTGDTKIANWSATITSKTEDRREIRDTKIKNLSNIVSFNFVNSVNGTINYTASREGFKIKALLKGSGYADITFNNGMVLKGPVHSETVTEADGKTTVKLRFSGTTENGDILILALRDEFNVLKVYLNGEPVSADVVEFFGLSLIQVASARY